MGICFCWCLQALAGTLLVSDQILMWHPNKATVPAAHTQQKNTLCCCFDVWDYLLTRAQTSMQGCITDQLITNKIVLIAVVHWSDFQGEWSV